MIEHPDVFIYILLMVASGSLVVLCLLGLANYFALRAKQREIERLARLHRMSWNTSGYKMVIREKKEEFDSPWRKS